MALTNLGQRKNKEKTKEHQRKNEEKQRKSKAEARKNKGPVWCELDPAGGGYDFVLASCRGNRNKVGSEVGGS